MNRNEVEVSYITVYDMHKNNQLNATTTAAAITMIVSVHSQITHNKPSSIKEVEVIL